MVWSIRKSSMQRRWIERIEGTRAVAVMPEGQRVFEQAFGVRFPV
jgi:hypothetical protein